MMITVNTSVSRKILPLCCILLVLSLFSFSRSHAQPVWNNTVHTVTTLVDELDASMDPALGTGTSLREAIEYSSENDKIEFDPALSGTIYLTLGEIAVLHNLIIEGPGISVIEVNGNDMSRILVIDGTADVLISDLTFSGGRAVSGACIYSEGWLRVEHCAFRWSTAVQHGGAMYYAGDELQLYKTRFTNCDAYLDGGAVSVVSGDVTVEQCEFFRNNAGGNGGAMLLACDDVQITQSTFSGNTSLAAGGALFIDSGTAIDIDASTLDNNKAKHGGAISNDGDLAMINSTISTNEADYTGGGIDNNDIASMDFCTVAFNKAETGGGVHNSATFNTRRSIYANNSAALGPDFSGNVASQGTNLVYIAAGGSGWIGSDLTGTEKEPMIAALDDLRLNGGVTKTHALLVCSRAVDAADDVHTMPQFDQRGSLRNVNGDNDNTAKPDIGAFEAQGILDTEAPDLIAHTGYHAYLDASGQASFTTDDLILNASDNCSVLSKSISRTSVDCSDLDSVQVTLTVTDRSHLTTTKQVYVQVRDNTAPSVTVTPVLEVYVNSGCTIVLTDNDLGLPATSDNCGVPSVSNDKPASFPVGTTPVIWTVEDNSGNTTTAFQLVTVLDTLRPVLGTVSDLVVDAHPNSCNVPKSVVEMAGLIAPNATDNCAVTVTSNAPATFPLGETIVIWTAKDASGNETSVAQKVTVVDNTPPVIFAPLDLVLAADVGICGRDGANVSLGSPVAYDNCGSVTVTNDKPSTFPLGETPVEWTAEDSNGNIAIAIQKVTIFDGTPPDITAPADIEVEADQGECYWTVDNSILGAAEGKDDCAVPTVTNNAGSTLSVGLHRIIWMAVDDYGNRSTAVQLVNVVGEAPAIVCPPDIVIDTDPGKAGAVVVFNAPTATSTCSDTEIIRTSGLGSGSFFPVGETWVDYMVIDGSNQIATCSFLVTVVDNEAPQITVKLAPRYLWPADNKLYDIKATVEASDNVPGVTVELTEITCNQNAAGDIVGASFGVFDDSYQFRAKRTGGERVYTAVYTAKDVAGNTTIGTATVKVPTNKPKDVDFQEGDLPIPNTVTLAQNYPNPFNPTTLISFGIPDAQHVVLNIYNSFGRLVRTLVDVPLDAGSYVVEWDAYDDAGIALPSGVYIYLLHAGADSQQKKMMLVR